MNLFPRSQHVVRSQQSTVYQEWPLQITWDVHPLQYVDDFVLNLILLTHGTL